MVADDLAFSALLDGCVEVFMVIFGAMETIIICAWVGMFVLVTASKYFEKPAATNGAELVRPSHETAIACLHHVFETCYSTTLLQLFFRCYYYYTNIVMPSSGREKDRRRDDGEKDEERKKKRREEEQYDDEDEPNRDRRRKRHRDKDADSNDDSENENGDNDIRDEDRRRRKKRSKSRHRKSSSRKKSKKKSSKKNKKKKSRRRSSFYSSEDDSNSNSSSSSSSSSSSEDEGANKKVVMNDKLLAKLSARGETLEERKERRAQKRAAKIQARFGYTAEENPFNDPNLHETFTWTKKKQQKTSANVAAGAQNRDTIEEIETIRRRRKEREVEREEMDRLRAEEARMKELENYDEWQKKEEEFHLEQQRKRSAIRLVEGREKPIDILAKNLLLFGLTEEEKQKRAAVKYQERYNALDEVQKLDAELEEPHKIVGYLKLVELQELLVDIDAFRLLEKEAMGDAGNETIIMYWEALSVVVKDEIKLLQNGGEESAYAKKIEGIKAIFKGQSRPDLVKMREEIQSKLRNATSGGDAEFDKAYWLSVMEQLTVHLAKTDLSELHAKMLVRQLEKLEQRKEALSEQQKNEATGTQESNAQKSDPDGSHGVMVPSNVDANFGNLEEELGLTDEVALAAAGNKAYSWQDRYAPRKPRYFNRVRTGFDWNKYNQTHYDSENPPPKIVQGYKFNIFYPDLVDPTKTPQFFLEPADSDDFCILRFHAGPPYEDIAFKIINREWNKSRKRGFRSTFERGVLSLYFNFTTHWYRR